MDWSDLDLYQHVNNVSFMRFYALPAVRAGKFLGSHRDL
ncbi:hypothetical protein [Autumnicola edwardsiae]|uniref:Acyl-ACP thioesterase-like C-terminal domain-containing protein n=1 Tax=Autumnicola edwardsiae TaxID=3075594 RepID=A0ABU3CSJ7_9FLAO|nr:hypothetical protein [Zunongwangia sp. F297]MDT0649213.1 hypothetical protein [Zunongwangia sp. F297]